MSRAGARPERVRMPYVEQLAERLSSRDWSIISTVNRLRIISGSQLERLHFHELTGHSRSVKRAQVLKRLVDEGVLVSLPRRVGTANRGSAQHRYVLDSAGQWLAQLRVRQETPGTQVRRPRVPSDRFVAHTLAVSELDVRLVELSRVGGFTVAEFQAEADAYWPDGLGGWIKMDASIRLERDDIADYWWYEADMPRHDSDIANESLPTIRRKCLVYLNFFRRGQLGPDGILPRVLFGVPTHQRVLDIQAIVDELPTPAGFMFRAAEMTQAAQVMADEIARE